MAVYQIDEDDLFPSAVASASAVSDWKVGTYIHSQCVHTDLNKGQAEVAGDSVS